MPLFAFSDLTRKMTVQIVPLTKLDGEESIIPGLTLLVYSSTPVPTPPSQLRLFRLRQ
jgi:hypothetical protein